jgi:hypothetical protein
VQASFVCSTPGPEPDAGAGTVRCQACPHSHPRTTESYKKKLWDGYEISLGPVPHSREYGCPAAIYNSVGKVVFRTNGYGGGCPSHEHCYFPANSRFTASLTTFPSTRMPAPENRAMTFFITAPISFIVGDPISAITVFTPATISSSPAALGR